MGRLTLCIGATCAIMLSIRVAGDLVRSVPDAFDGGVLASFAAIPPLAHVVALVMQRVDEAAGARRGPPDGEGRASEAVPHHPGSDMVRDGQRDVDER